MIHRGSTRLADVENEKRDGERRREGRGEKHRGEVHMTTTWKARAMERARCEMEKKGASEK